MFDSSYPKNHAKFQSIPFSNKFLPFLPLPAGPHVASVLQTLLDQARRLWIAKVRTGLSQRWLVKAQVPSGKLT